MAEFYHYTLEKHISDIRKNGMFHNSSYTTAEYFDHYVAGQEIGVAPHNIECVLKFRDDGQFRRQNPVSDTVRFRGGGSDYLHPLRIRPIAKRRIKERSWINL
jgi:hypothetical protein